MDQDPSSSPSAEQPEAEAAPAAGKPGPESPGYALPAGYAANPPGGSPRKRRRGVPPRVISLAVAVVVIGGGALVTQLTSAKRGANGQINHAGTLQVTDLKAGDCFNNPSDANGQSKTSVDSVKAIPCTSPHDSQIFAKFNLTEGSSASFPGDSAVNQQATKGCNSRIGSLDKNQLTNSMELRVLVPEQDSWSNGDRAVSCMIHNPTATLTSSLLKG